MCGSESVEEVCASCGKAAIDGVFKLKKCACDLVKYCSVDCQKNHRKQHKKACKKRLAEIRDDDLFTMPDESHYGECPICCLPLPLDDSKFGTTSCCCKRICYGCNLANQMREKEQGLERRCVFCREPVPFKEEGVDKNFMERAKVNDPIALLQMGQKCCREGDNKGAVEYWTKAAELGDIESHFNLSVMYREGTGVEKDEKKEVYHLEEATIGGHPSARFNLGLHEMNNGRFDRGIKHWIIAAKLGYDKALEVVKGSFQSGFSFVSKEDYETALRGHQAAVDATKSEQREEAYAA
jgi:hypothetical protein